MSFSSGLSISLSSEDPASPELNNSIEIIQFFTKNNITLSALRDTFKLMGRTKSKYLIDKDIKALFKFDFIYYIKCEHCKIFQNFRSDVKKKNCLDCSRELKLKETNFFTYIPIKEQIIESIRKNFNNIIKYNENVCSVESDCIRDIHDGDIYKNLKKEISKNDNGSMQTIPLSFVVNTDGVQIFNIGNDTLWPILLIQNFLPPNIRYLKENIIVVGLFYGKSSELPVHAFFRPLCEEFNDMSTGFQVKEYSSIRFLPYITHAGLDSPAKNKVQCFQQHNAKFGCCICYIENTPVPNKGNKKSTKRPLCTEEALKYRGHADTLYIMTVVTPGDPINGIKDISPFIDLEFFDIIKSFGLDYLHMILKGSFEKLCTFSF